MIDSGGDSAEREVATFWLPWLPSGCQNGASPET